MEVWFKVSSFMGFNHTDLCWDETKLVGQNTSIFMIFGINQMTSMFVCGIIEWTYCRNVETKLQFLLF